MLACGPTRGTSSRNCPHWRAGRSSSRATVSPPEPPKSGAEKGRRPSRRGAAAVWDAPGRAAKRGRGAGPAPGHFPALQRAASLIDYAPVESNFTLALTTLSAQLNRRSLIILFTEFTDATSADLMIRAAGRLVKKHRLLFVVLKDEELENEEKRRPESAADVTRSNVAAAMLRDRQLVIARLQRLGADVLEVPADAMAGGVVDAYLNIKRQGTL